VRFEVFTTLKVQIMILVMAVCCLDYLGFFFFWGGTACTFWLKTELVGSSKTSVTIYIVSYLRKEQSKKLLLHYALSNKIHKGEVFLCLYSTPLYYAMDVFLQMCLFCKIP
jgi:hypothetical protein